MPMVYREGDGVLSVSFTARSQILVHDSRAETNQRARITLLARALKIVSLGAVTAVRLARSGQCSGRSSTVSRVDSQSAFFHGYFPCR